MLFKKTPPAAPRTSGGYCWPKSDVLTQSIWINVRDWQYKVFPSRASAGAGTWMFQFEANTKTAPIEDAIVTGTIEVVEPGEVLSGMSDHWTNVPSRMEGYTQPIESSAPGMAPDLAVALLCQSSALDSIHRAFLVGASSRSGGISIEITVDCPNNTGGDFWYNKWRTEWLRVASWKLFAGAKLQSE